jgi:nicotinate-nucleotide adenylyltransferase
MTIAEPTALRTGIFGGTFDPVHVGHLIIADAIRHELRLDQVIFLPAKRSPFKENIVPAADHHRLAMLSLAIEHAPEFKISPIDLDRPEPSYTVDSLRVLRHELPEDSPLFFIAGQDTFAGFPDWRDPAGVLRLTQFAVASRPGVVVDLAKVYARVPEARGRITLIETPLIDISSTDIRRRVAEGNPYRFLVPRPVSHYIHQHRLYRTT